MIFFLMLVFIFNQFFFFVGWLRLLSQVLHQSRDFLGSDVSLESQCGCHLKGQVQGWG